jgi:hypothetical protein
VLGHGSASAERGSRALGQPQIIGEDQGRAGAGAEEGGTTCALAVPLSL